jgi:hypothetical protein
MVTAYEALFQDGEFADDVVLNATKPSQSEFVALSRDRDGAIGTAAAFFDLSLRDGFDEERVGFRRSDS